MTSAPFLSNYGVPRILASSLEHARKRASPLSPCSFTGQRSKRACEIEYACLTSVRIIATNDWLSAFRMVSCFSDRREIRRKWESQTTSLILPVEGENRVKAPFFCTYACKCRKCAISERVVCTAQKVSTMLQEKAPGSKRGCGDVWIRSKGSSERFFFFFECVSKSQQWGMIEK